MCHDPPCIVMQYYPHGSLFDLLHRAHKGNPKALKELSWSKRLDMLRDVAAGMQYLHSRKPPVIHGDLRCKRLCAGAGANTGKELFQQRERLISSRLRGHLCLMDDWPHLLAWLHANRRASCPPPNMWQGGCPSTWPSGIAVSQPTHGL